jgi:NitT/TauT family transport system substrate-binding protein
MMKKVGIKFIVIFVTIILILALLAGALRMYRFSRLHPPEDVTIAVATQPISALIYIAHDKGFFAQEGLNATLQSYWVGKDAKDSVLSGRAQFATVAETPLMYSGLRDEPIAIVATVADSNRYMKIVARKDHKIAGPLDLAGKRIGVTRGTTGEYFLYAFLTYYQISPDQIIPVDMKAEAMAEALERGTIDAAVTWNPHAARQLALLGANGLIVENSTIYYKIWWNVVGRQDYVISHNETVQQLLRALIRAQKSLEENPQESLTIVEKYVGKGTADLKDFNLDVRLGQSLLLELEDQARWAIGAGLTERKTMPNFLRMMYPQAMEVVDPVSVSLIYKRESP